MAKKEKSFQRVFMTKFELFCVILFVLSLFLLDVNLNLIASYEMSVKVPVINGIIVPATSMFWLGFIAMSVCFFIICVRSFNRRKSFRGFDVFFSLTGIIGWGIILSGGLLIFFGGDNFSIPFFNMMIRRIDYYHVGIGLEILTLIYFALTNDGS